MMATEYYTFTGRVGEEIPQHITHVLIDRALKFVPGWAFIYHPNIEEVICHDGVEKIEELAFYHCPRLRRVIMPGVKIIQFRAFDGCRALTYIECGKLEIIVREAFLLCESLSSIDLPSIKTVERYAFGQCRELTNAKFGKELESFGRTVFCGCTSLERITLPLKNGIISHDDTFRLCFKLNHIDLVEGVHKTIAALLLEKWRNEMYEEIDSISQILPNTSAGRIFGDGLVLGGRGGKADVIRLWITSVLHKFTHYKTEHRRILSEATVTLQSVLPNDIVLKNILPFLELPPHTFEGEN